MPTLLNAAAVDALALEESVMKLFEEWLRGFFDGGTHVIGAAGSKKFPQAQLRFQQSALPQPLSTVGITAVWVAAAHVRKYWEGGQQISLDHASWMFLVRTDANSAAGNADLQCRTASDLLYAILANSAATRGLGQKGINKICPTPAQLLSDGKTQDKHDPNYITRLVSCRGMLRYRILSQT